MDTPATITPVVEDPRLKAYWIPERVCEALDDMIAKISLVAMWAAPEKGEGPSGGHGAAKICDEAVGVMMNAAEALRDYRPRD